MRVEHEPVTPIIASRGCTALDRHLLFAARLDLEEAGIPVTASSVARYSIRCGIPAEIAIRLGEMVDTAREHQDAT